MFVLLELQKNNNKKHIPVLDIACMAKSGLAKYLPRKGNKKKLQNNFYIVVFKDNNYTGFTLHWQDRY